MDVRSSLRCVEASSLTRDQTASGARSLSPWTTRGVPGLRRIGVSSSQHTDCMNIDWQVIKNISRLHVSYGIFVGEGKWYMTYIF